MPTNYWSDRSDWEAETEVEKQRAKQRRRNKREAEREREVGRLMVPSLGKTTAESFNQLIIGWSQQCTVHKRLILQRHSQRGRTQDLQNHSAPCFLFTPSIQFGKFFRLYQTLINRIKLYLTWASFPDKNRLHVSLSSTDSGGEKWWGTGSVSAETWSECKWQHLAQLAQTCIPGDHIQCGGDNNNSHLTHWSYEYIHKCRFEIVILKI